MKYSNPKNPFRNQRLFEKQEVVKQQIEKKLVIPNEVLNNQNYASLEDLVPVESSPRVNYRNSNSRCVPVGTKMIAPGGRKKKKMFKAKKEIVKFRCSVFEKKLLTIKAKRSGLTISEYCRKVAYEKEIKERLSDDHLEIYKSLVKFHNNFKSIGNMFRKKDPKLSEKVYRLAEQINLHLQKIKK